MFDLEKAIGAWRRTLRYRRAFLEEDLDELESHLRDHVEALLAQGYTAQEAFGVAVRRLGDAAGVEDEYRKVFWIKLKHRRALLREFIWEVAMLRNYVKVALRSLRRHPGYTFINVSGLAVGMACCLLILLWVRDEVSYDRYHDNADRVYRVTRSWVNDDGATTLHLARISAVIGPLLEDALPEVRESARIWGGWGTLVSYDDEHYQEANFYYVEPELFDLFSIPFVRGTPEDALAEPFTLVLTESTARKYFGDTDPIGRVLRVGGEDDFRVTGVVVDPPANTHFHFDLLGSFATLEATFSASAWSTWSYNNYATYLLLADGGDPAALEAKLPAFIEAHYDGTNETRLHLQALPDIHLHSHVDAEFEPNGDAAYVYVFSLIAFFILLIACFNFMNLATARSTRRAKEVGLRKVLGADRPQLIRQFMGEAALLALLAQGFAVGLVALALPAFNAFAGKDLGLFGDHPGFVLLSLTVLTLFVGAAAGSYPALFLSAYQPARVLKGVSGGSWRSRLRAGLVVTQFAISIVLIVGVAVVSRQLDYLQNKRLGFDQEHLVVLPASQEMGEDFDRVRDRLLEEPGVQAVTASTFVPSQSLLDNVDGTAEVSGGMRPFNEIALLRVDPDFTTTYGVEMAAGRAFSKQRASDSTQAFVLNEAAVKAMGWSSPEQAVGKAVTLGRDTVFRRGQVIGVMRDFHFESLHERIAPLLLVVDTDRLFLVTLRIDGQDVAGTLAFLEERWKAYRPGFPFTPTFVDARFGQLYGAERRVRQLFGVFAGLAVVIACLGLFGLAAFTAEQRTKEVGVRKVLGASVPGIVALLSRDFLKLVLMAFVVAAPVAYLAAGRWLQGFAYHVEISWPIFLMAGLTALGVALLTVSYQAVRAALADPVESLRNE